MFDIVWKTLTTPLSSSLMTLLIDVFVLQKLYVHYITVISLRKVYGWICIYLYNTFNITTTLTTYFSNYLHLYKFPQSLSYSTSDSQKPVMFFSHIFINAFLNFWCLLLFNNLITFFFCVSVSFHILTNLVSYLHL